MKVLPDPFYYLHNFHQVLDWIADRYSDLLLDWEADWISSFQELPENTRALLVRFVMRKGRLFRSSKLRYQEIGCTHEAAKALVDISWVDDRPLLCADEIYGLLNKAELAVLLQGQAEKISGARKTELYEALQARVTEPAGFHQLFPESDERIYRMSMEVAEFCDRLRLMFFGNPHQGWTEFVLADLGIFQYEKIAIDAQSRAFQCRGDVDAYLHLQACRERFHDGESEEKILSELKGAPASSWLAGRQAKLLYQIAYQYEQAGEINRALEIYRDCAYPDARLRTIRVLEKIGESDAAYELAESARQAPVNDEELQKLQRLMPRLRRKLGLPSTAAATSAAVYELNLTLPFPNGAFSVEEAVRRHLHQNDAPVIYVENSLLNSLFGLLCWDAIFHPVPGAFFHPFHTGPADLHSPDFYKRRMDQFTSCLSQLDSEEYKATICARFEEKAGIQSPFVFWGAVNRELLELALDCMPASHLRHWFLRILQDIKNNRTGFPDLIQFWPQEKRYHMIEVKGPGDRLQDNQLRLLSFAQKHDIPISVCYVDWAKAAA
jgi:hypothetical protein